VRHRTFTVRGADVDRVVELVAGAVEPDHRRDGDGFTLLLAEGDRFWRADADLQVTVLIEGTRPDCCVVEVTAGGASGDGVLGFSLGSEQAALDAAVDAVEDACREADLRVE
jgi:hypothetical protein